MFCPAVSPLGEDVRGRREPAHLPAGRPSRLIPLLMAARVFTTRARPRDHPQKWGVRSRGIDAAKGWMRAARAAVGAPGLGSGEMAVAGRAAFCWVQGSWPGAGRWPRGGFPGGVGGVAEQPVLSFAGLLRQLRAEARLTQEELAEAASMSPRSVSDLERGITRTAHKDTAVLLADALGLPGAVAELFVAAARGRGAAAEVLAARDSASPGVFAAAATRALPRDIAA